MGALTQTELMVELLSLGAQLTAALGARGALLALGCFLLVRALLDDTRQGADLLCATSVLLVLVLVASN